MSKTLLRALALLLVLGLLAGCAVTTRRPSGRTDGALTHDEDDPAPAKPNGDDPEARPNRAPDKPESPETPTVTAGGVAVHTDYSAYTPYAAPEPVYTRLTPEHIADLKASDDYGAIYPFMGELLYSPSGWGNGGYFGFFDDSGRIVADPTYSSVIQLCSYTGRGMEYKPYWLLSRTCNVRTVQDGEYSYLDSDEFYAVASLDGSFVTDCIYRYVTTVGDNVLCMPDWRGTAFTLYAPDGSVLLTDQDISFADRIPEYGWSFSDGGDGRIIVDLTDGYYYMDLSGELLLGPFAYADAFYHGLAAVSYDTYYYGVIALDGSTVLLPVYTSVRTDDERGILTSDNENHLCRLYSRTGELRFEVPGDYIDAEEFGFSVTDWDDDSTSYLDESGGLLLKTTFDEWSLLYRTPWLVRQDKGDLVVRSLSTGREGVIKNASTLSPLYYDLMAGLHSSLPYLCVYNYDKPDVPVRLLDEQLRELLTVDSDGYFGSLADTLTGEAYLFSVTGGRYTVYDSALHMLAENVPSPQILGGLLITTDERATTARTLDGTVRFCYPLVTSLDD